MKPDEIIIKGATNLTSAEIDQLRKWLRGIVDQQRQGTKKDYYTKTEIDRLLKIVNADRLQGYRVGERKAAIPLLTGNNVWSGTQYIGGANDAVRIDPGGTLTLIGNAKIERHIQIEPGVSGTPANQPTAITIGTAGGLQFPSTPNKTSHCQWEIPDDWDGADAYIELDWLPDSGAMSGTDTVKWNLDYRSIAEGESIINGTAVSLSDTDSSDYAQYTTKHTRFTLDADNANQPMTKQDHMYFLFTRDTTVANDFAGTVVATAYEIIYYSVGFPTSN